MDWGDQRRITFYFAGGLGVLDPIFSPFGKGGEGGFGCVVERFYL
jgi:hypothetical protein